MQDLPSGSVVNNPPAMQEPQETWDQSLGWDDALEEGMATHSSILPGESHGQRSWQSQELKIKLLSLQSLLSFFSCSYFYFNFSLYINFFQIILNFLFLFMLVIIIT